MYVRCQDVDSIKTKSAACPEPRNRTGRPSFHQTTTPQNLHNHELYTPPTRHLKTSSWLPESPPSSPDLPLRSSDPRLSILLRAAFKRPRDCYKTSSLRGSLWELSGGRESLLPERVEDETS